MHERELLHLGATTALLHAALSHTPLFHAALSHTPLFHAALSHTPLFHEALSHTPLFHAALLRAHAGAHRDPGSWGSGLLGI